MYLLGQRSNVLSHIRSRDFRSSRGFSFSGNKSNLKVFLGYVILEAGQVLTLRDKRTFCC